MKAKKPLRTSNALQIIHNRYYAGRPAKIAKLQQTVANDDIARKIRQLRDEAGLSQRQMAKLIGTTASVICRLEDADYEGHSLAMLTRLAAAMNQRVRIDFVPLNSRRKTA